MELPQSFLDSLNDLLPAQQVEQVLQAIIESDPPVSIRLNPAKMKLHQGLEPIPWASNGFYLSDRPIFTADPLLHSGAYYVQEPSSMVLEQAWNQCRPEGPLRVLDLCAAPGGKSTHLDSLLREDDLLVANEVIQPRARVLAENLTKWGADVLVTNNDPRDFSRLPGFFDVMLVDAPCSGEGMFRKDPNVVNEWSPQNVALCCQRQQRVLADAWDTLADDGLLIFATCTFNHQENEEILHWLTSTYSVSPVPFSLDKCPGAVPYQVDNFTGYRLFPGLVKGEGFSFFVVRKEEGVSRMEFSDREFKKAWSGSIQVVGVKRENFFIGGWDNHLVGTRFPTELAFLKRQLRVVKSGVMIGEQKKNKLVPAHELALSLWLDRAHWQSVELTLNQALSFQMKEPFELDAPRGFVLLTYQQVPLGWINHLGSRFNSLFPTNWRILTDYRIV